MIKSLDYDEFMKVKDTIKPGQYETGYINDILKKQVKQELTTHDFNHLIMLLGYYKKLKPGSGHGYYVIVPDTTVVK